MKRGLSYGEALAYVGVKRRTFDRRWRPLLKTIRHGTSLIFDRRDLDELFDQFKSEIIAAHASAVEQNGNWNERPFVEKGDEEWAEKQKVSIRAKVEPGRSTSGGTERAFASVASEILRRHSAGR